MSEKNKSRKIFEFSLLGRVFHYAAPYKRQFYISIILAILLAILSPVRPYLIQYTVNNFVKELQPVLEQTRLIEAVVLITIIQIGLVLVESGFRFYFHFLRPGWGRR